MNLERLRLRIVKGACLPVIEREFVRLIFSLREEVNQEKLTLKTFQLNRIIS